MTAKFHVLWSQHRLLISDYEIMNLSIISTTRKDGKVTFKSQLSEQQNQKTVYNNDQLSTKHIDKGQRSTQGLTQ